MKDQKQYALDKIVADYSGREEIGEEDVQIREHRDEQGQLIAVTLSHQSEARLRDAPEKYGWIDTKDRGFVQLGDPDLYEANDGSYHHLDDMGHWPEDIIMEYLVQAAEEFGWQEAQRQAPSGWTVGTQGDVTKE